LTAAADAAPQYVRLSFVSETHSSTTISWNTTSDVGTEVQYGTQPGNLSESVTGSSEAGPGTLGWVHQVELSGLDPQTTYYYRAGDAADGYSDEYFFTTGPTPHPDCASFRFAFIGDNRPDPIFGGGQNYENVLQEAFTHQPAFVLNGGDLVNDGDDWEDWHDFLDYTGTSSPHVPYMPALGNHDTHGQGDDAPFNKLFALPRSEGDYGSNTEDYYYFVYGNAVFVVLSTETYSDGSPPFATQASYLDEVLTAHPQKWKIVFFHKPVYAYFYEIIGIGINHEPNEEGQNEAFVQVIDEHHVDVVLQSHNHWYERYGPSACANPPFNNPGSEEPCPVNDPALGTIYYISGGAGAFTIPNYFCEPFFPWDPPVPPGREACSGQHHFLMLDVEDEKLTIDTWSYDVFGGNSEIIDTFEIVKQATDCDEPSDAGPDGSVGGSGGSAGSGGAAAGSAPWGGSSPAGGNGAGASAAAPSETAGGCGCRLDGRRVAQLDGPLWLLLGLGLGLGRWRLGRRRKEC